LLLLLLLLLLPAEIRYLGARDSWVKGNCRNRTCAIKFSSVAAATRLTLMAVAAAGNNDIAGAGRGDLFIYDWN